MSGFNWDEQMLSEKTEEMLNHQARMIEKMAEALMLYREYLKKYPNEGCCETMTLDEKYKIYFRFEPKP